MVDEQIKQKFKETYPDLMRGDTPLSPYFDIWEYAIEIATNELEAQVEKMKRCEICKHYRWNHCSYEINISADCIQNKLKHFELKEKNDDD